MKNYKRGFGLAELTITLSRVERDGRIYHYYQLNNPRTRRYIFRAIKESTYWHMMLILGRRLNVRMLPVKTFPDLVDGPVRVAVNEYRY